MHRDLHPWVDGLYVETIDGVIISEPLPRPAWPRGEDMKAPKLNEKIEDELRKTLEHIAGEMRQRIIDLEAKAERPWGGALSGRTEAAEYVAQACREANAIFDAAIAQLPPAPQPKRVMRPVKSEPPLHPAHPDREAGKPAPRG